MQSFRINNEEIGALDFTKKSEDQSILDLSYKKDKLVTEINYSPVSLDAHPLSPKFLISNEAERLGRSRIEFLNQVEKSPSTEGRMFMVTPPESEGDSPDKLKYQSPPNIYPSIVTSEVIQYPLFQMNHPTMTSALLSSPINPQLPTSTIISNPNINNNNNNSFNNNNNNNNKKVSAESIKKAPRPFKAYPKDPLTLSESEMNTDPLSTKAYCEFRDKMLDSVRKSNEGTNIRMRRTSKSPGLPTSTMDEKNSAYWERRRKNNEAAKRSRDARRVKEDEIAIRAAFLEQENMKLKYEIFLLRNETAKLRGMMQSS